MKIILVLFVILIPSGVWATQMTGWPDEPCANGDAFIDTVSKSYVVCEHKHWHLMRSACESDLEAAMRAMEPFMQKPLDRQPVVFDDLIPNHDTRQDELRKEIARLDQLEKAWEQWATVKRECWKQ